MASESESEYVIEDIQSLQEIDKCFRERELLRKLATDQEAQIRDLQTSLKLTEKMNDVLKREVEMTNRNFEQMKEVADRAIKLAESKKSNIWEMWGPLAVIAIVVVTVASVL